MKNKTRIGKKAQVQSMQTIIIAVFMFIIIAVALLFYFKVSKTHSTKKIEEVRVLKGLELVNRWQKLPELACPSFGAELNPCIDMEKAEAFKNFINSFRDAKAFYSSLLGNVKITINKIYPGEEKEEIEIFNNILEGEDVMVFHIPITVYSSLENKKFFGIISIEMEVTSSE